MSLKQHHTKQHTGTVYMYNVVPMSYSKGMDTNYVYLR